MAQSAIEEVVHKLTSKLYFHGHPINSREAREEVGLNFVEDAEPDAAEAMWALYEIYHIDLALERQFNAQQEAIAKNPLAPPPAGAPGVNQQTVQLDPLRFAIVESVSRTDTYEAECEITILRDAMGNYQSGQPQFLRQQWVTDVTPPTS